MYRIPPNNGQQGAPDVACESGFCFQGFPQMAIFKHAVVITANEFDLFGETFYGASVYAVGKAALVAGSQNANTALTRTFVAEDDELLASLQPARQTGTGNTPDSVFLMSVPTGSQGNTLQLLTLQGTETLATQHARVTLDWVQRNVQLDIIWAEPPPADQKLGMNPLGRDTFSTSTPSPLDALDGRMASVSLVDGKLFCAWGTGVATEAGNTVAGVAYAVVDPHRPAKAMQSGLLRAPGSNHLLFPCMAVRPGGEGVVALSISGPDYHPSPAYAVLSREGLGQLTVITQGAGVLDGFLGYLSRSGIDRVGDYSAAVLDANGAFWVASGYVAQSCSSVEAYKTDTTCGGTRATGSNWVTRVTQITLE